MKKIVVMLSIVLTLVLAGVLYGTHDSPEKERPETTGYESLDYLPDPMPEVMMDPIVVVPF
jgi:hypothetical protein